MPSSEVLMSFSDPVFVVVAEQHHGRVVFGDRDGLFRRGFVSIRHVHLKNTEGAGRQRKTHPAIISCCHRLVEVYIHSDNAEFHSGNDTVGRLLFNVNPPAGSAQVEGKPAGIVHDAGHHFLAGFSVYRLQYRKGGGLTHGRQILLEFHLNRFADLLLGVERHRISRNIAGYTGR